MSAPAEVLKALKGMGLSRYERSACMDIYRDAGESEAMESAKRYQRLKKRQLADAKQAAAVIIGGGYP